MMGESKIERENKDAQYVDKKLICFLLLKFVKDNFKNHTIAPLPLPSHMQSNHEPAPCRAMRGRARSARTRAAPRRGRAPRTLAADPREGERERRRMWCGVIG